jgi:Tat protein secretion system quality control protein TatD with DNase activity
MSLIIFHNFNKKDQNILKLLDLKIIAFLSPSGTVCCTSSSRDMKYFELSRP